MSDKYDNLVKQYKSALVRFDGVLQQKEDEFVRDSAIQRFEFTFELAWKTMKAYAEDKGIKTHSPKDAMRSVFQLGLIDDDPTWLKMIETRNKTSHTYNQALAEEVYKILPKYLPLLKKLSQTLS